MEAKIENGKLTIVIDLQAHQEPTPTTCVNVLPIIPFVIYDFEEFCEEGVAEIIYLDDSISDSELIVNLGISGFK